MESLIGKTFSGYRLTGTLGSGPSGDTFTAVDTAGDEVVAKLIHGKLSLMDRVQGFWQALQKLGPLANPHIAVAHKSAWTKNGRFLLIMPRLTGIDLQRALDTHGRLPAAQVLLIVGQACLALQEAHDEGVVHGAIKPRNIFLVGRSSSERVSTRITDFCTTLLYGGRGHAPLYMAPEQFLGETAPAADVYALGAVLLHALSGRPPFVGSLDELAHQHAEAPPVIDEAVPAGLATVIRRALAKVAKDRFADVSEMRRALEAWAAGEPSELATPAIQLFGGATKGDALTQDERTVRVPVEDISKLFEMEDDDGPADDDRSSFETPGQSGAAIVPMSKEKQMQSNPNVEPERATPPQDGELAAVADRASAKVRAAVKAAATDDVPRPEEVYFDDQDDPEELPLERSVKAFVATLSPTVPASAGSADSESLEAALDQFVADAKAWSAALPQPAVDDRQLAELAKDRAPEPEPEPAPAPAPMVTPGATPAAPRRNPLPLLLVAFVLGGALVFAGMKFLGVGAVPAGDRQAATPATPAPTPTAQPLTPEPGQPATETAATETAATAETAPASEGETAGGEAAAGGETATASETTGSETAAGEAATASEGESAASGETATASEGESAASGETATASETAGSETAAATAPAKTAHKAAASTPDPATKRARRKVRRAQRKARRARRAAAKRPATKKTKTKTKKQGGSDWVDPFSQ